MPGPVFNLSAFLGGVVAGLPGALLAWASLFGPGLLLILAALPFWQEIQAGIQCIEPTFREVLVLRDIEGLSAKEVAEIVGISVPAVKSRLHRARAQLREHLSFKPYKPALGCPDIRKVFSEHLEGDLSPGICSTMEAHVASCTHCAAECDGLKAALNACSTAPSEVPAALQERVQMALRAALERAAF